MEKGNYLCLLKLLNFESVVLQDGNDMFQIRFDRMAKDLSQALEGVGEQVSCMNIGSWLLLSTRSDDEDSLKGLLSALSAYNKQALLFGCPHKGIIFRQKPAVSNQKGVEVFNSRALIGAKVSLAEQSIAGIVADEELCKEKKATLQAYTSIFEGKQMLKIFRTSLASVAFEEVKKTLKSNFSKVGISENSSEGNSLKMLLKFMEAENR